MERWLPRPFKLKSLLLNNNVTSVRFGSAPSGSAGETTIIKDDTECYASASSEQPVGSYNSVVRF
jgi:hypothetical protein